MGISPLRNVPKVKLSKALILVIANTESRKTCVIATQLLADMKLTTRKYQIFLPAFISYKKQEELSMYLFLRIGGKISQQKNVLFILTM